MEKGRALWAVVAVALSGMVGILIGLAAPIAVTGGYRPEEATTWVAQRAFAFMSYWMVTASVVYGLLLSTKLLSRFAHHPVMSSLHRDLAAIALGLAGIHGTLLMLHDPFHLGAWEVMIPFFSSRLPIWVGAGQIALYLLVLIAISWYLHGKLSRGVWQAIYGLMIVAFLAATLHGLIVGSSSDEIWAVWIYAIATSIVAFLLLYRLWILLSIFCDKRRTRREQERRDSIGLSK